jgi:uncharacterized protein YjgD (DUF1641 family)
LFATITGKVGATLIKTCSLLLISTIFFSLLLQNLGIFSIIADAGSKSSETLPYHSYVVIRRDFIVLGNNYIELTITLGNNTGGGIYSIKDKLRGVDFIRNKQYVNIGLFALEYWYDPINWYAALLGRNANLEYSYSINETGATLNLFWSNLTSTHEERKFTVNVHVEIYVPSNSSITYWQIEFENKDNVTIENIFFPIIVGLDQLSNEEDGDYLVLPSWSGILFKNPIRNMKKGGSIGADYPSGFLNMQFIAYYSSNPRSGLYLANYDDSGAYLKRFSFSSSPNDNNIWLVNTHIISLDGNQSRVSLPYRVVLGIFSGDWYDAAKIYKEWASKQWWARGNLTIGKDTPIWLKKSGVVIDFFTRYWERNSKVWNGPYSNMPPTAEAFRAFYNTTPILWWRGWEKNGFGMTPPDYLPPSEGWSSFDLAVRGTHYNGGRVMVPVPSILTYSFNASGWQEAVNYAPRDRWGNLYTQTWYIHNNSGIVVKQVGFIMAPTDFWLNKILNISLELVNHGVDVVQLDGGPPPPFINYHGDLPRGGGNWWAREYMRIYHTVREEVKRANSKAAIGSEWLVESFIPYIDLGCDEAIGGLDPTGIASSVFYNSTLNSFIPLWQAVYHEHILLFSSILIIDGQDSQYYLRNLALSLVWGDLPMIDADPQGTGRPYNLRLYDQKILEYSRRIVEARSKYAYHYLVEGVMLRPPLVTPNPRILIPGASTIPYSGVDVNPFYSDSVFASAWLAPDKSVGIVITSIAPYQLNITITLADYNIFQKEDLLNVYIIVNGDFYSSFQSRVIPREVELSLAPYDVALIVISPHSSLRARAVEKLREIEYNLKTLNLPKDSTISNWKLMENMTTLSLLIEQIHALKSTITESYTNASTPALKVLLDIANRLLEEALLKALNLNFTASEMLINASKEKLSGFYSLRYLTLEAQKTLEVLLQTFYTLDEIITSIEGREVLEHAGKLLGKAKESINSGEVERAMQLLSEANLLMKEAIEKSTVKTVTVTMERTIVPTETSQTTITSLITIKGGVEEWNRTIVLLLILLIVSIVSIMLGRVLGKKKQKIPHTASFFMLSDFLADKLLFAS